ncbi:MAG: phenylalanine--tRNA ligase subunit beta [Actinobacteria bacterium]|nr:phenylalanine--tRNA ligase subunit beta [Actinomycetota bacterium]
MLVPFSWLKEYVHIELSPDELAKRFDLTGTAVESVKYLDKELDKVIVGLVVDCEKHPNADRLKVCQVDIGEEELRQIVCGAPNVEGGQVVPVGLPGARLPNGIELSRAKIRGIESNGMICSKSELGLGEDAAGIMVLDSTYEIGTPLAKALGLDDVVFELEVTANRPDCLGMIGVAREAAAITAAELKLPSTSVMEGVRPAAEMASVEIKDPELCPRYEARLIMGVKIGPSPLWMRRRLEKAGVRPISNIVDATNYVMIETGQPLHAFDFDQVGGGKIIVRRATEGERIVTLDEVERLLLTDDLVIADASRAIAIAGIMGGGYSEVTDRTVNVLLEAAHFKPESIMRTSRRLGLFSEASARFEKGVDPNIVQFASDRAIELMRELAGGEVLKGEIDVYPTRIEPRNLTLRTRRVNAILGASLETKEVSTILSHLGLGVKPASEDAHLLKVTVPTFRFDLEREIDLVEEVARLYGYDVIESTLPESSGKRGGLSPEQRMAGVIAERLISQGLFEARTYSFMGPQDADNMNLPADSAYRNAIPLLNPLSEEQSIMRTSLLPGLLKVVRHNLYREQYSVKEFEVGRVFMPADGAILPEEKRMLGIVLSGRVLGYEWYDKEKGRRFDFYDLKGVVTDLVERIGIGDWSIMPSKDPRFHPGKSADLLIGGEPAGAFGQIHPAVQANYDLPVEVMAAEISHDLLIEGASLERFFEEIPRFPGISLDVALVVDESVTNEEIIKMIEREGGDILESAGVFDVFQDGGIPAGKKSVAYTMTYRSTERTLTVEEAKERQAKIVARLQKDFNAIIRS